MECIICKSAMSHFFSKTFNAFNLENVDYWKCRQCGFCASKTHYDLSDEQWAKINNDFHSITHFTEENPYNRNQRYFNQATMLMLMTKHGLIKPGRWLDWGCGTGRIASLLDTYYNLHLNTYDKYFTPWINSLDESALTPRDFDLVLNTAVFEHVRSRETLDEIESYAKDAGCLAIHTLVPENIPNDPDWMYLLPVHCSFHTNNSMQKLMQQWGYTCSVYNEHAKLWVWFREDISGIDERVQNLNKALGWEYLHFKPGFMDYWK